MARLTVRERLESSIEKIVDGCWLWKGCLDKDGYGVLRVNGKLKRVHRLAYESFVGPIPQDHDVDHGCWVRNCCRPEHLEPLTIEANRSKQRAAVSGHCKKGHEFAGDNLYIHPSGRRGCRACNLAAVLRYKARRQAA